MSLRKHVGLVLAPLMAAAVLAGCGGGSSGNNGSQKPSKPVNPNAAEKSPPGDIPDNQAFVRYAPPHGGFTIKVPEGWARTLSGPAVTFTDKLNSIRAETAPATAPLTVAGAGGSELRRLARASSGFKAGKVTTVHRPAGAAVLITYLADSKRNAVTGKATRQAVERYAFFHKGRRLVLTLSGAKGADNIDPWRIVTDSVRWTG